MKSIYQARSHFSLSEAYLKWPSNSLIPLYFQKFMPDYFALGDTNKDGYIDYNEFRGILDTFELPLEKTKVN